MSKPPTPDQMIAILKRWDIPYKEYKTWRTHNRGDRGNGWGNMHGLILHHTGSNSTDQREMLWDGFPNANPPLPGPLCHFGIAQDGTVHLIGWGRANHAGGGDPNVLQHVINEDYTGRLTPHYHEGSKGAVDGNGYFYGGEIWYDGNKPMTASQYRSATRLGAGITEFHKWSELSVIMHGEWSDWKWDPGVSKGSMINPVTVRSDIKALRKTGPVATKPPTTPPPTKPPAPVTPTIATLDAKLDKIMKKLGIS